jgi:hypothetical protein
MALQRDRFHLGDGVVLDLLAERAGDVLALTANRRRRSDVGAVPALAARPPDGATQTIVGTSESSRVPMMSFVASRLPPGVLSRMTTAAAPSRTARAIPSDK